MDKSDKSKPFDPLADSLNIDTELELYRPGQVAPIDGQVDEDRFTEIVDADYEFARKNVTDTILKAVSALDKIIGVAEQSQAPRAYEVVATLTKVIVDAGGSLMDLSKRAKDIKETDVKDEDAKTINNNLIVTTDQLQRMLQDQGVMTTTRVIKKPQDNEVIENGTTRRAEGS